MPLKGAIIMNRRTTLIPSLAGMALCMLPSLALGQTDTAADENAARALRILRSACDHLAGAKTVRVTGEGSYDQINPEGIRMELAARRIITLQRPDRVHVQTDGDAGSRTVVFHRGQLGILSGTEKVYGEATLAPTLDEAIDQLANQYGTILPTADLLLSDPYEALTGAVRLAAHLGEHAAAGKPCDHLAFQTENVDFQVWVEQARPPVIRKLVIAFKNEPGVPQFRASFDKWEFDLELPAGTFDFKPPQDFAKVEIEPAEDEANDAADEE
jgi:hypothetical protein